jgi:hypothetical protein
MSLSRCGDNAVSVCHYTVCLSLSLSMSKVWVENSVPHEQSVT